MKPDQASQLIQYALSIVSILVGASLAIFAEPARKRIFRPRVSLRYDDTDGCFVQAVEKVENLQVVNTAWYVRVQVHNTGRYNAKSCRPFLARIERLGRGNTITVHQDALPLEWAFTGKDPIDIPVGMYFYMDILRADDVTPYFSPCTKPSPKFWAKELSVPGTYRLKVLLTADEVKPQALSLLVTWTGKADQMLARKDHGG